MNFFFYRSNKDIPHFYFETTNLKRNVKADSVVLSAKTIFNANIMKSPSVKVNPSSYPVIKEMIIAESVEINIPSLTLNKCKLNENIKINMPQIILVDIEFNP